VNENPKVFRGFVVQPRYRGCVHIVLGFLGLIFFFYVLGTVINGERTETETNNQSQQGESK
jgi:hypothetical protein